MKTTTYAYDESGHRQLTSTTMVDSEGKQIVTAHKYPTDYTRGPAPRSTAWWTTICSTVSSKR